MSIRARCPARYWGLLVQILLLMALLAAPFLVGYLSNSGKYTFFCFDRNISPSAFDEAQLYAPPAERFFFSHALFHGTDDVYELRHNLSAYPVLPPFVFGGVSRLLGSMDRGWIALQIVLPLMTWLLVYLALGWTYSDFLLRSVGSWTVVLLSFGPRNSLLMGMDSFTQQLEITRSPHPSLSFPLFLGALLLTARAITSPRRRDAVLAGTIGGLLFYTYYFYLAVFFIATAAMTAMSLLFRRTATAKRLIWVIGTGMIVGLPQFFVEHAKRSQMNWLLVRQGGFTHAPHTGWLLLALVFAVAWIFLEAKLQPSSDSSSRSSALIRILVACIFAGIAGVNLHVITGFEAQHLSHFPNRVLQPVALILGFVLLSSLPWAWNQWVKKLSLTAVVVVVLMAGYRQIEVGRVTAPEHNRDSSLWKTLDWVSENAPRDAVISSDAPEFIVLLPLTGRWTFVPSNYRTNSNDSDILERYLIASYLAGASYQDVMLSLQDGAKGVPHNWLSTSFLLFVRLRNSDEFLAQAKRFWEQLDLSKELTKRKLSYVLVPPGRVPRLPTGDGNWPLVYENDGWRLFQSHRP